ncbi:MAG: Gfo/Idh/MocA family oxidoreductase [Alphaproteobacteria bacterium]|nr:Gfo/Idh/MocA family oxidoreductase [Alphaproteobacteria bacterium]MDA7983563.1 Gfo/Idh/MocA family oxidoreductase [Alphaproteobacteria bacterium]MDA7989148.1 Gfo/Idh/MocA family oxidoreductase [Alphaproteobacteria bacterium]MDA8009604.1 Gfo/Idh/MocA family oxidoreductase [Alphaproteobacteria bacterium]
MKGFALFGAGFIGAVHAECVASHSGSRLVCVYDPDAEAARRLAGNYGARVAGSVEDALATEGVDVALVASATFSHVEVLRSVIAAGKDFLCEKPLSAGTDGAREVVALTAAAGVFGAMGFNRRHDAQHLALRGMVSSLGSPEIVRMTSRSSPAGLPSRVEDSGGLLREKGAHFFDLSCWLLGERPREIYVAADCLVDAAFGAGGDVDTAAIVLRFGSGALCLMDFSRRSAYGYDERVEVFGAGGVAESGCPVPLATRRSLGGAAEVGGIHGHWLDRLRPSYGAQLGCFLGALDGDGAGEFATVRDGLVAELIAAAGLRSIAEGRSVEIDYTF